jgi:hypothetical protein
MFIHSSMALQSFFGPWPFLQFRNLFLHICSRWFLARGFFYPEDGGDIFLRNVGSHKIYTAPHPRRRHSSSILADHLLGLHSVQFYQTTRHYIAENSHLPENLKSNSLNKYSVIIKHQILIWRIS